MTLIEEIDDALRIMGGNKYDPEGVEFHAMMLLRHCRDRLRWVPELQAIIEAARTEALGGGYCSICTCQMRGGDGPHADDCWIARYDSLPLPQPPQQEQQEGQ